MAPRLTCFSLNPPLRCEARVFEPSFLCALLSLLRGTFERTLAFPETVHMLTEADRLRVFSLLPVLLCSPSAVENGKRKSCTGVLLSGRHLM